MSDSNNKSSSFSKQSFLSRLNKKNTSPRSGKDILQQKSQNNSLQDIQQKSSLAKNDSFLTKNSKFKLYSVYGKDRGKNACYVIKVDAKKTLLFEAIINKSLKSTKAASSNNQAINLEEYGEVVFSKYGDKISEETIKMLNEKYNTN